MENVLVIGGTGQVGRAISELLLQKGHNVTVLLHQEESLTKVPNGANVVKGDLEDPSSLENIADDMNFIVATAAALDGRFAEGYTALMRSAEKANVRHIFACR